MTSGSTPFVSWFADIGMRDRASVGGKGASLGEMTRAGIRVPPGFVITTAAFDRFLASVDGDGSIRRTIAALDPADMAAVNAATSMIRERLVSAALPPELESEITAAYRRLGDGMPVAVRSSATSEDSEDASFAGLQDTELWVRGEAHVAAAVRRCWASLYSAESVTYRLRLKLPEENVAMGVVVQRMVNARSSGVMFTRSPVTGDRSVIAIEGSWGLGSAIVSGEVTPDKFVVSKVTGEILQRKVAEKLAQHVPDERAGGVRSIEVPDEKRSAPCIDDAEIAALADIARRIERHYGMPQDIEWAIEGQGADGVFLLQSRPETVWRNREREPIAKPKARPFDHVFAVLGHKDR
ncbi:MAG: PEP/pyruvate-binding domain-containing protein [Pseudomonadota bacterium]|jgi:Phosphoenolpyruvate synthase/pyruvate phosphate dikinase|nr:MAG: phosphoenolpyruvate synthase [Pseudomonadota bacterium]